MAKPLAGPGMLALPLCTAAGPARGAGRLYKPLVTCQASRHRCWSSGARAAPAAPLAAAAAAAPPRQAPRAALSPLRAARPLRHRSVACAAAAAPEAVTGAFAAISAGLAALPWWGIAAAVVVGTFVGLAIAKMAANLVRREVDPNKASLENAELRAKVEELQQLVVKLEPLAYKGMRLRFTKGINKAVILGMVDQMLANKDVNIWWLPDEVERLVYFNIMTLMLQVLDEVVDGMSINFAGHNVKLQLTYLDVEKGEASRASAKTAALVQKALESVPRRTNSAPAAA